MSFHISCLFFIPLVFIQHLSFFKNFLKVWHRIHRSVRQMNLLGGYLRKHRYRILAYSQVITNTNKKIKSTVQNCRNEFMPLDTVSSILADYLFHCFQYTLRLERLNNKVLCSSLNGFDDHCLLSHCGTHNNKRAGISLFDFL